MFFTSLWGTRIVWMGYKRSPSELFGDKLTIENPNDPFICWDSEEWT